MTLPDLHLEEMARARGLWPVAGVDEAGRGPLAGPVVAAAVILPPGPPMPGLNDSKQMTARARARAEAEIRARALVGTGIATVEEIDTINILRASHLAMRRAVAALAQVPGLVLVDGPMRPGELPCDCWPVVGGDAISASIAAASIIAKETRDRIMVDLAQQFPGYGWQANAGYPTKSHKIAIQSLGVTPHHRRSFRPVHNILYQDKSVSD